MCENEWVQIHENEIYQMLFPHLIAYNFSLCEHLIDVFLDRLRPWMEIEGDEVAHHFSPTKLGKNSRSSSLLHCSHVPVLRKQSPKNLTLASETKGSMRTTKELSSLNPRI
jgi:hypothetical protein